MICCSASKREHQILHYLFYLKTLTNVFIDISGVGPKVSSPVGWCRHHVVNIHCVNTQGPQRIARPVAPHVNCVHLMDVEKLLLQSSLPQKVGEAHVKYCR